MSKADRGFASMDPERRREICSKGGYEAHRQKTAHEWTKEEAKAAAAKSLASRMKKRAEKELKKTAEG